MQQQKEQGNRINILLSGWENILSAISDMRNKDSDAHGAGSNRIKIEEHHARLFVNSGITMAKFILSVSENQRQKQKDSGQQNHICQPESFFIYFHNIVTISVPSVKVKTIRSSLCTVT